MKNLQYINRFWLELFHCLLYVVCWGEKIQDKDQLHTANYRWLNGKTVLWLLNRGTQRFLLNNLKTLLRLSIQSTLSYLEMHSKRSYKCSVTLGELKTFRNYQGLRVIFPKMFRWNLTYNESEIYFLILNVITFLNPKNLGSLFFYQKQPDWGS